MAKRELWELQSLQASPLKVKVKLTQQRIREWVYEFGEDGVCVSFSGGKDSTVLLHIVREMFPNVPAVFADTGLEFPEIRDFVKTFDNVVWVKPKMTFKQVIEKYGYPMISKEVSECVYGARKYLTSVLEPGTLDRPTDLPYSYHYRKLNGTGEYSKERKPLRQSDVWNAIQKAQQVGIGGGGRVWQFIKTTGTATVDGTIDPRLWKNYRQFAGPASDGDKSEEGEYP